jgi:protein-tyrosine phosphatase
MAMARPMVDIHSHIVWGVDDGPGSMEESLAILKVAAEGGTSDLVATPHANLRYAFDRRLSQERIQELAEATGGLPALHLGCEFHLSFDNIARLMDELPAYTINSRQYLLVECPDFHIGSHTETVLERLLDAGIVPIVAHPERNPILRAKLARVEAWVDLGCLLQLTAMSITGGFGGSAKAASMRMLERGLAHLVASDAHDAVNRHPRMEDARRMVSSRFGEEAAETLFLANPRSVIEGKSLPAGRQTSWQPPPWYQFWKRP